MTFDSFNNQAWAEHFVDAAAVAARFDEAVKLVAKPEEVPLMAKLVTHVTGEHLGQWPRGLALLAALRKHSEAFLDDAGRSALDRFERSLRFCAGNAAAFEQLSSSDLVRIQVVAGPALAAQGEVACGTALFREAIAGAANLEKTDPAQRDLAAAGNNLSLGLEGKSKRTPEETELMLLGARTGRKQWEIAGGPLQVMRAEYRLSMSYTQAGQADEAVKHAEISLELAAAHSAGDTDVFFLYEALAYAERARGKLEAFAKAVERAKDCFSRLSGDDRDWCKPVLETLTHLVGGPS